MEDKTNLVFEEEDVKIAEETLRKLGSCVHPGTEEAFLEGGEVYTLLHYEGMKDNLLLAADVLNGYLQNHGFNRVKPPARKRPLAISEADRTRIAISNRNIGIMTMASNINDVLPYDMRTLHYNVISNWLVFIGAMQWEEDKEGRRRRAATKTGESMGMQNIVATRADGSTYRKTVFTPDGQQFIIDNLDSILTYKRQQSVREAIAKVEQAEGETLTAEDLEGAFNYA